MLNEAFIFSTEGKPDYARASDFVKELHARVDQLQAQAQEQDSKRREEVAMLRRELRQAHAKMETSIRQKDVNETSELENAIKRSIRQENVGKDLKEIIHSEIDNYLTGKHRNCFKKFEWEPYPSLLASIMAYLQI